MRKKGGADKRVFPAAMHYAPVGHAPRSVSMPMISRSRYCWGTAAIEITGGSHIDLADGLETGSPYFHLHSPGLVLSRGGSLSCSSSPLSESVLICSSFLSKKIYIVLFRVARMLPIQCAHYGHSRFILWIFHFRPCLLVWVFDCI